MTKLTRRTTLGLLGGLSLAGMTPPAFAQGVEGRKLVFVFLRGAVDGLSAVIPDDEALIGRRPNIMPDFAQRHDLARQTAPQHSRRAMATQCWIRRDCGRYGRLLSEGLG